MSPERDKPWDERVLELAPSGVDGSLITENLKLTPGERIAKALPLIEEMIVFRGSVRRR
ncbi:MAG: hypothetical protein ACRELY_28730 [Polyangiaceae bacterium]